MRSPFLRPTLAALLLAGAVAAVGCNREPGTAAPPQQQAQAQPATAAQAPTAENPPLASATSAANPAEPQTNELQPKPPQQVVIDNAPPSPAPNDLDAKAKQLAKRQAALDAREKRLREREARAKRTPQPEATAPAPSAEESAPDGRAEAPAPEPAREPEPVPEPVAPRPEPVTVPSGTSFDVELTKGLASNTSAVGETFRAKIASDISSDGVVVIPGGSEVVGVVTDAVGLGRVGGQAKLAIKFTDLVLPSGSTVPIHASLVQKGRDETKRSAAVIGGSAAGGAILGRILSGNNRTKGTIVGALVGALAGAAVAAKTGQEVVIPEGTVLRLQLDDSVRVRPPG